MDTHDHGILVTDRQVSVNPSRDIDRNCDSGLDLRERSSGLPTQTGIPSDRPYKESRSLGQPVVASTVVSSTDGLVQVKFNRPFAINENGGPPSR